MGKVLVAFLCVACAFGLTRAWQFRAAVKRIGNQRGLRYVLDSVGFLSFFFPWRIRFVSPGRAALLLRQYQDFKEHDCDIITSVSVLPTVHTSFYVADPEAMKTINANRMLFPKPTDRYAAFLLYGPNIVSSEGDEWKRFRKVCAPSFSERNNQLVWNESIRIAEEMFEDRWNSPIVNIDDVLDVTSSISLFVISAASFGKSLSWKKADNECPPGYKMTFRDVIRIMSEGGVAIKMITPNWLLKLGPTQTLREAHTAFSELKGYMLDMIAERRATETKETQDDLFSNLLAANEEEEGLQKLSDDELVGNVWIMLIAGHATTGALLFFALALLAIHQDEQATLYDEIREVLAEGESPKYSDISRYSRAQAVLYETLRTYSSVQGVFKTAVEDTVLTTHTCAGDHVKMSIPKGSEILVNILAMHYHPRYWGDPQVWRPARFLEKDWPRDAFMAFSSGARACIGRRFAEVEAIAVLVMIISRYEVHVKEDPKYEHESLQEREQRILRPPLKLSFKLPPVPLVFKKRYLALSTT